MSEVKQLTYGELLELTEGHGASAIYERLLPLYTDFDALLAQVAQLQGELREYKAQPIDLREVRRETLAISTKEELHDWCIFYMDKYQQAESHLARLRGALVAAHRTEMNLAVEASRIMADDKGKYEYAAAVLGNLLLEQAQRALNPPGTVKG